MNDPVVQTIVVAVVIQITGAVVAWYLWTEDRKEVFLLFWSLAWLFNGIRWALFYLALEDPPLRQLAGFVGGLAHVFFVLGSYDLLPTKPWRRSYVIAATVVVLLGFSLAGAVWNMATEMEYARALAVLASMATCMAFAYFVERLAGYAFAAVTIAAWGIYVAVGMAVLGPDVRTHIVIPMFSIPLLFSIVVIAYQRSRRQLMESERTLRESEEGRWRAEQGLRQQRDELAHALRVTTLGELAASFAHELGQPLTAILSNAQALRRILANNGSRQDADEVLADIAAGARRGGDTIQRLQALFRKEPGVRVRLDMNALVDDVLRLLKADLLQKQIQVRFTRAAELPPVLGDAVQLRQVVLNVLVNAGEAILADAESPRDIYVETRHTEHNDVTIIVRDTGVGAAEADLERMFSHFVTTKPQGLGMGLAISRSIIESHGGRIWAACNEPRGLALHIVLPAS